jgi:hypothetical protein
MTSDCFLRLGRFGSSYLSEDCEEADGYVKLEEEAR